MIYPKLMEKKQSTNGISIWFNVLPKTLLENLSWSAQLAVSSSSFSLFAFPLLSLGVPIYIG